MSAYTLSEHESKRLLAEVGIAIPEERLADSPDAAARAARELGLPVVLKLCGRGIAHKTERGLVRLDATVAPPTDSLDLSDLVLVCGASTPVSSDPVRIEPNLERRVWGNESMAIYLEIGHLQPGRDGRSRFLYSYSILPVGRDAKRGGHPVYEASREEDFDGTRRRQFITVPTRSIRRRCWPAGTCSEPRKRARSKTWAVPLRPSGSSLAPARRTSTAPEIPAIGLRSSWAALETKSAARRANGEPKLANSCYVSGQGGEAKDRA